MKVLIIDNDPGMCQLMTMAFEYVQVEVVATGSLAEAERLVLDESFGALLMDYHLGGGQSGYGLLKKFHENGMALPFWLVTGTPHDPGALKVKDIPGCQGIIAKPFSILELVEEVKPLLLERATKK